MSKVRIKLDRQGVKKHILLDESTQDILEEAAADIATRARSLGAKGVNKSPVSGRTGRVAVDVYAQRTKDLVKNHILEKAIQ